MEENTRHGWDGPPLDQVPCAPQISGQSRTVIWKRTERRRDKASPPLECHPSYLSPPVSPEWAADQRKEEVGGAVRVRQDPATWTPASGKNAIVSTAFSTSCPQVSTSPKRHTGWQASCSPSWWGGPAPQEDGQPQVSPKVRGKSSHTCPLWGGARETT